MSKRRIKAVQENLSQQDVGKQLREILAAPEKPFPVFSGDQQRAYESLCQQLKLDLRKVTDPPQPPELLQNASRPADIPEAAWSATVQQIRTELAYKSVTYLFFRRFDVFNVTLFQEVRAYFTAAQGLAQASAEDESSFYINSLIKVGNAALGSLDIPGIGIAIALFEVALEWGQENGEVSRETVQGTFHQLSTKLAQDFKGCSLQVGKMEEKVLWRWGSLEPMGRALVSGHFRWPARPDEVKMHETALTAYKISIWQIILPAVWNIMRPQNDPRHHSNVNWFNGYIKANPHYYLTANKAAGDGYWVTKRWLGRGAFPLGHQQPTAAMCQEIFVTLKVERQQVFLETGGWKGFHQQTLIECSGSELARVMAEAEENEVLEDHLRLLRKLRDDLATSLMGKWYLRVYDEIAPTVMQLYHEDPNRAIAHAIEQFRGKNVYDALVEALRTGSSGLGQQHLRSLSLIVQEIVNTSVRLLGAENPVRRRMPEVISRSFQYVGKSYPQVLQILRDETPPD